jgi:hypothetical protein
MTDSFEQELVELISEAVTNGEDVPGAYAVSTENGESYEVHITEVATE